MKKNFFKKLSFVLALAMIVTALAPAAGAFAAKAPKLNASTKYLYLDQDGKNEFDFNISNKKTGWKYAWSTSNAKVATVNKKNGVTLAKGAGTATISVVISDKDGEEFDELSAKVVVRDNIKELTITNLPAEGKVAVGVAHDFNRSYVTDAGKTTGSQAITRWSVGEGATIDDKGVFTATKAGEYTITARAFQSKAKYTSWLTDATKYADYVTAEATYKVTVAPSMTDVNQTTLKKFDLTFDSAMTKADVEKNLTVSYTIGGTKVKELVKGVTLSEDSKTATVEMYANFTQGTTYVVEYPEMKAVQFVSATAKVEEVVDMAILTKTAQISKEQKLDIALYNKDGVNIANDDLVARVTLEKAAANNLSTLVGRSVYMYKLGEVVSLKATFHTYNWVDGKEVGNVIATGDITCVDIVKDQVGTIHGWSVTSGTPTNFNTPKTQVFKNVSTPLRVVLKGKDANGNDMYTANYDGYPANMTAGTGTWKYTTTNRNVLLVDNSGNVYGVADGTASVVVSYNDVQVGACEITVAGAEKLAMASLSTNSLILSNEFADITNVTFEAKNQLTDDYKRDGNYYASVSVSENFTRATTGVTYPNVQSTATGLSVNAAGATAGTYGYTVKITDKADGNNSISLNFSVTVQDPGDNTTVAYYKIETNKLTYEVKSGTSFADVSATLSVYGYNSAGIKVSKLENGLKNAVLDNYNIEVKNPDGATVTGSAIDGTVLLESSSTIKLAGFKSISGGARRIAATEKAGSWLITATPKTSSTTTTISPVSFEVTNSQPKATYTVKKFVSDDMTSVSAANVHQLINECITVTVGDRTVRAEAEYIGADYEIINGNVTLRKIKFYEQVSGIDHIEHEINFGGLVISAK